jgi:hypothetical protein
MGFLWSQLTRRHTPLGRLALTGDAAEANWRQANRVLDALFLEYDVQTRDRRLNAQSMMALMGFVVAAFAALSGAWAQSRNPAPLILIAPLMLAGAEGVLLLRVHLLRVSVYLTLVEEDIRKWLRVKRLPIAWETTMTGRVGAAAGLSSPGRSAPGLSILAILAVGVFGAVLFTLVGLAALDSPQTADLTNWLPGYRRQQEVVYVLVNVFQVGLLAATWVRQTKALTDAREHFREIRSRSVEDGG